MKNVFKTYEGIEYGINECKEAFFIDNHKEGKTIEIPLNKIKKIEQFMSAVDLGINLYIELDYIYTITVVYTEDSTHAETENAMKDLDRFIDMYGNDNRLVWGEDYVDLA